MNYQLLACGFSAFVLSFCWVKFSCIDADDPSPNSFIASAVTAVIGVACCFLSFLGF